MTTSPAVSVTGGSPIKGARSAGCEVSRRSDVAAQSIIAGIKPHN